MRYRTSSYVGYQKQVIKLSKLSQMQGRPKSQSSSSSSASEWNMLDFARWACSNDCQIKFEKDEYSGQAGGASVVVKIIVADGDGTPNPFADFDGVGVSVTSPGSLDETGIVVFSRYRDAQKRLRYEATVHVSSPSPGPVTLSLSDTGATGLDTSNEAVVTFS